MNGQAATRYGDNTFARGFTLTAGPDTFTAVATDAHRSDTNAVTVTLPASVSYTYDDNGNLTSDGQRTFEYDAENQLTAVTVSNAWRSEFKYDGKLRRRVRTEKVWTGSAFVTASETRYVYDGMLVVQERDANNVPTVTYTRGRDLSGSQEGAGGIGGLLARTSNSSLLTSDSSSAHAYYHADGNGNITALVNGLGTVVARYLYDPYGNLLAKGGALADANSYRFSSKEVHPNSGMYYYGYRFYDPNTQRWPNRDPIEENGGVNLYGFVENDPVNLHDPLGELPPSNPQCQALKKKIENLEEEVRKRTRELYEDPQRLPGKVPGDDQRPSQSRRGHQKLLNMAKANLAAKRALYNALCNDPEPPACERFLQTAAEAIPGTPQQLQKAGEVLLETGVVILGSTRGGGRGPFPRPVPTLPQPGRIPVPIPAPGY